MNEIEKIGKIMCEEFNSEICGNECECCNKELAEKLIDAGYGDTKQAVREFAEKVKKRLAQKEVNLYNGKSQVIQIDMQTSIVIDELVKEVCGE